MKAHLCLEIDPFNYILFIRPKLFDPTLSLVGGGASFISFSFMIIHFNPNKNLAALSFEVVRVVIRQTVCYIVRKYTLQTSSSIYEANLRLPFSSRIVVLNSVPVPFCVSLSLLDLFLSFFLSFLFPYLARNKSFIGPKLTVVVPNGIFQAPLFSFPRR